MIHRAVEALDREVCRSTVINRSAGRLEQIGHQPCRDRLAAPVLLVLAGVSIGTITVMRWPMRCCGCRS